MKDETTLATLHLEQVMRLTLQNTQGEFPDLCAANADLQEIYAETFKADFSTCETAPMVAYCSAHSAFVTAVNLLGLSKEFFPSENVRESMAIANVRFSEFLAAGDFSDPTVRRECLSYMLLFATYNGGLH